MEAGLDVARINFSHGTHEQHARTIAIVRDLAKQRERPVAILGDLQGPRIRIGDLDAPRLLEPGSDVVFCPEESASGSEMPQSAALSTMTRSLPYLRTTSTIRSLPIFVFG